MDNIINLDFSDNEKPAEGVDFYETRKIFAQSFNPQKIIISIVTWNQLEKTKKCVEYLLKYTSHIDFDLVFFDNNSEDETIEFLKTVDYPNKTIFSSNKNMGIAFALNYLISTSKCEYYININNDCYVTKNWLDNTLACFKSDEKIVFISPMSSNMSNVQDPGLKFNTLDEMQKCAELFNKPDPTKWQERVKVIGAVTCYRKHIFDLIGIMDSGFIHNFSDDDISLRIFRSGYKQILLGDVFIHHDHDHSLQDQSKLNKSLKDGKNNFNAKYKGIDAWDDFKNFEFDLLNLANFNKNNNKILGIDVRCGVPLFSLKNKLRQNSNNDNSCFAYTTKAKYYHDLVHTCQDENNVFCDRIDFITEHYNQNTFDFILLGEYINSYAQPYKLLDILINLLTIEGQLFIKLKNVSDFNSFISMLGVKLKSNNNNNNYVNIDIKDFLNKIVPSGHEYKIKCNPEQVPEQMRKQLEDTLLNLSIVGCKDFMHIYASEYLFCITKTK